MQQNIRKELKNLCLDILKQDDTDDIRGMIDECEALLQKLLVADYLLKNSKSERIYEGKGETSGVGKGEELPNEGTVIAKQETAEPKHIASIKMAQEESTKTKAKAQNEQLEKVIQVEESETIAASPLQAMADEIDEIDEVTPSLGLDDFKMSSTQDTTQDNAGSINARFAQGRLNFGLNDRIAFVKNLFGGNMDDFNRVISQLNTFEDFEEAENFVENLVKPEYDWYQKEEYEMRFKNRIRQRFGLDDIEEG